MKSIIKPLSKVTTLFDANLKNLLVHIRCIWVKVYIDPVYDKGLCIRSYDRLILKDNPDNSVIGSATGNYYVDPSGLVWLEIQLLKCDRYPIGWARETDVNVPMTKNTTNTTDTKISWMGWVTAGLGLLSLFR